MSFPERLRGLIAGNLFIKAGAAQNDDGSIKIVLSTLTRVWLEVLEIARAQLQKLDRVGLKHFKLKFQFRPKILEVMKFQFKSKIFWSMRLITENNNIIQKMFIWRIFHLIISCDLFSFSCCDTFCRNISLVQIFLCLNFIQQ